MVYFSIVIPLFNKAAYIENTLKSVLNQSYDNYEIIVVNDGCTDGSDTIVNNFKDYRIQLYNQENQGAAVARNFGIDNAKYEHIAFIDADDIWMEDHLETLKKLIENFPNSGIYASRYQLIFKNGKNYIPEFKDIPSNFCGIVPDYFSASLNYAVATSSSISVPKYIFEKIGHFKSKISSGQDSDMWIRVASKFPVVISNKVTASYLHYIENSLSKTPILDKKIKDFNDYKQEEEINPSLKKYLDIYRMEYAMQYKIAGDIQKSKKLYQNILKENISLKSKFLYYLPQWILIILLKTKKHLRNKGFDFSIYQ
jgi:glycosyltransferase involved in cell wall biosynthesis